MNNGVYTLFAYNGAQVSSASVIELGVGAPRQKLLVFSGIAIPEMGTDDDDEIGHPRVFVRLGRFVQKLVASTVEVGLASIANDESGFVLAVDGVAAQADPGTGELFLDLSCAMSGEGTYISRIAYQAVCVIEEAVFRIAGEITWPATLRNASEDTAASLQGVLQVRSGRLKTEVAPNAPPDGFGVAVWEAFGNGAIIGLERRGEDWVATYEVLGPPLLTPVTVVVDVQPAFASGNVRAFRNGGPEPVVLSGIVPEVGGVNFFLDIIPGVR